MRLLPRPTTTLTRRRPRTLSKLHHQREPPSRTFLPGLSNLPSLGPASIQHLSARRTLPYPPLPIYDIIAAVPDYQSFLPYCTRSTVTRWSRPDAAFGRRWPEEAVLDIGWAAVRETFRSNIFCVPGKVVEAVGGGASTRLDARLLRHHTHLGVPAQQAEAAAAADRAGGDGAQKAAGGEVLTHLLTRWTVSPVGGGGRDGAGASTVVDLDIEFQFANPVYAAMSSAVADRVAEVMIEAFEKRVETQLKGTG